jgi:hypothetical protein
MEESTLSSLQEQKLSELNGTSELNTGERAEFNQCFLQEE